MDVTIPRSLPLSNVVHLQHPDLQASGLWIVLSEAAHGQENLYEGCVSAWYPTYLMTHFALSGMDLSGSVHITHTGGTKRGFLAFSKAYSFLGQYVPWQTVQGGSESRAQCVEFETAITLRIDWSFMNAPVISQHNPALVGFGDSRRSHLTHGTTKQPSTCRRKCLFGMRNRSNRSVLNKGEVQAAVRLLLKGFEVTMTDLRPKSTGPAGPAGQPGEVLRSHIMSADCTQQGGNCLSVPDSSVATKQLWFWCCLMQIKMKCHNAWPIWV